MNARQDGKLMACTCEGTGTCSRCAGEFLTDGPRREFCVEDLGADEEKCLHLHLPRLQSHLVFVIGEHGNSFGRSTFAWRTCLCNGKATGILRGLGTLFKLERIVAAVRNEHFLPDATRSGRWRPGYGPERRTGPRTVEAQSYRPKAQFAAQEESESSADGTKRSSAEDEGPGGERPRA